ncbi:hypothetical protein SAMN05421547_108233 [Delftia lacustris]|jgi:hypothetical protein|uniref:Uncharacterized protein n=1 Tax=Delftia lacustris TaxID=558537 RepID=A0A1H3N9X3_9BURK|nr:hypothetical protein SAMN05421547_108233 [Delftia lacustris]
MTAKALSRDTRTGVSQNRFLQRELVRVKPSQLRSKSSNLMLAVYPHASINPGGH